MMVCKEEQGHLHVRGEEGKNLAALCNSARYAHKNRGNGIKMTDDRIALLDARGFEWTTATRKRDAGITVKSFEGKVGDRRAYKKALPSECQQE